jgi:hypothetical protein
MANGFDLLDRPHPNNLDEPPDKIKSPSDEFGYLLIEQQNPDSAITFAPDGLSDFPDKLTDFCGVPSLP